MVLNVGATGFNVSEYAYCIAFPPAGGGVPWQIDFASGLKPACRL
jgi:hypothetical protein